uniref:Uncharacterized protein n=1 Tax=Oryza sativa subsp. japonica TaxID=39947 RepID=Q5W650_ORYSJ|nr:unknown protein [Oryza sativa Japonica Group]
MQGSNRRSLLPSLIPLPRRLLIREEAATTAARVAPAPPPRSPEK